MAFMVSKRRGRYWDDAVELDRRIKQCTFNTTHKNERGFESDLASALINNDKKFNGAVHAQPYRESTVKSIYCFGKKHRPDMAIDDNGIAVELKLCNYSGLKQAIGQGYLYRLQYKFVFIILVIPEKRKSLYLEIAEGREKNLEETLQHLADEMNIFTYIVPAFAVKKVGVKNCFSFFEPKDFVKE